MRVRYSILLSIIVIGLISCGGSNRSSGGSNPPTQGSTPPTQGSIPPAQGSTPPAQATNPPAQGTVTSVTVTGPSQVTSGLTAQLTAVVNGTGSPSQTFTWSASGGSVDLNGLLTAPATAGNVTVTATSVQDPTKNGSASITVHLQGLRSKHVVIVMEENQSYSTVVANSAWPNLNKLIRNGALATNYYANTHPSIGNYFMLTTGQILTNDDASIKLWNVDNIARRMLAAGVSFKVYAEGITQGYIGGNKGSYLIRHNPLAMLSDVAGSTQVANQCIWPFTQFATDLANGTLPEFSFIVPDINDDAHTGTPQQADSWLQTNVITRLSSYSAFKTGGDGILVVDFDEAATSDSAFGGGRVAPVFWGPNVKVGFTQASSTIYQQESMLRTMMDALGLSNPPGAAATAPSMAEFFVVN